MSEVRSNVTFKILMYHSLYVVKTNISSKQLYITLLSLFKSLYTTFCMFTIYTTLAKILVLRIFVNF